MVEPINPEDTVDAIRSLLREALGRIPEDTGSDRRFTAIRTAILSAIDATGTGVEAALSAIRPAATSVDRIVAELRQGLWRSRCELERKVKDAERSLAREERYASEPDGGSDPEYVADMTRTRDSGRTVVAMIDRMRETVENDPRKLLVPLGTVVETLEHHAGPYARLPVAGSRGVVVGYATDNENVNIVSFPSKVSDDDGYVYKFDETDDCPERPPSFRYPAEALTIVEDARAWGGTPIEDVGYVATHIHDEDWRTPPRQGHDMVVEAMGWLWRIQEINGIPERTQMTKASTPEHFDFLRPIPLIPEASAG